MIDKARFWKHVSLLDDSSDTCWVWVGAMRDDGRGRFSYNGGEIRAHWAAYEIQHGTPVPKGHRLEQTCNHPQCVRHWKLGGKFRKLGPKAVLEILSGLIDTKSAAKKYGVSARRIFQVRRTYFTGHTLSGRV
jgi:hypothetical protein